MQISPNVNISSRQMSVAAESIAAAQFALNGFDVLEHAGQARFAHDLVVAKSGGMLKLTVHASFGGFQNIIDAHLDRELDTDVRTASHRAVEAWLRNHRTDALCCLVQFDSEDLSRMPVFYLATAPQFAALLHTSIDNQAVATQSLPVEWSFSKSRIAELMDAKVAKPPVSDYRPVAIAPLAFAVA